MLKAATPKIVLQPASLEESHRVIAQLSERLQLAEWQIAQLKKQLFGPSSERVPDADTVPQEQQLLDIVPAPAPPPATQDVVLPPTADSKPKRPARHPQPKVVETVIERLEPAEKICPHCGQNKCEIGCERSERYEYIPARIIRHQIQRPKLACRCGQGTVSIAPLPPSILDKGLPDPGLATQVTLAKFDDHLPLYRQQQQFQRLGVHFARTTLCGWVECVAGWLQPLVQQMKQELLAGDYVQADETPIRVLDPDVKGKCAQGFLWVLGRPGGDVLFEFHPGRGAEYARKLLGHFRGFLQRDGYSVYGSLANGPNSGLIPVGCLAHGRRKFVEALLDEPESARWFVTQIAQLYRIEAYAREHNLSAVQRLDLRRQLAPPFWTAIKARLQELQPRLLPQSPLGKAIRYALNEWEPWQTYLEDGRLEIDNNLTENAIRPSAVGKKNYLFIGHPDAGWRSAVIYSVIVSCRRRQLDPWAYIKDVLTRLPSATNHQLPELVPARWQPAKA